MRSEYSWIPPGESPSHTGPHQVGVSFSRHRASVFVTGRDPITWIRIQETTEALEIYPDRALLRSLGAGDPEFEPAAAVRDGTVLAICSILKRVHAAGAGLSDVAA